MRLTSTLLCALGLLAFGARADVQMLYGATASGGPGELYVLDAATGAVLQDIGALNDAAGQNYGITGLAFHPVTGVLYGSVSNSDPNTRAQLVTIDPTTAQVTIVGPYGVQFPGRRPTTMADLTFDPTTNALYGVGSVGGPIMYSVDTATGAATSTGPVGLTSTAGGGLACNAQGVINGTPTGTSRFGTYDKATGAFTNIAALAGLPFDGAVGAMAFNDAGTLYGVNMDQTSAALTHLVTIDTATGAVTDVGRSAVALDAIAFRPNGGVIPEPGTLALLLGPGLLGALKASRRRR